MKMHITIITYAAIITALVLHGCSPLDTQQQTVTHESDKLVTPIRGFEGHSSEEMKKIIIRALKEVPEAKPYVDMVTGEFNIVGARANAAGDTQKLLAMVSMKSRYTSALTKASLGLKVEQATKNL